jgi:hypothetical protein
MYKTSNLVLVSLLIVVAIIAVGSLLFINTRREERPRLNIPPVNPVLPIIDSTPTPTPNQQVMIETNPSLFPTSIVTKIASRTQSPAPVPAPTKAPAPTQVQNNNPKPVTTSQVSSTPGNIDGNNDTVSENLNNQAALAIEVWDLTVREVQRYNDNQLLDNYVKAAMYVQQLYDMKARVNWVLDETDSLNYIPRTINNLRLLSNELRIRGIISELDFYKVLSYAEVYYRCTNDPSHIQCREGYDVDNELPSRYYPEYHNLNYTFSRYVNEIVNPEISKLSRVNRRYIVKYIQLRTAQDEREHLNRSNVNEATENENQNQANNNSGNNAPTPSNNNNTGNNAPAPSNNNNTSNNAPAPSNNNNTSNNTPAPANNNSSNNTPAPANNNSSNNTPAPVNNNSSNNTPAPANNNSGNNTPAPVNNNSGNNAAPGPVPNNTPPQRNHSSSQNENETPSPAPSGSGLNGNPV